MGLCWKKTPDLSWDLFNSLLPVDPLINSCYICLFLPSLLLSSFSGPSLLFSYSLRGFRSLSCCEGEAGWWWERGRARERSSLSPRCSSHLPALPWWVVRACVYVCECVGQQAFGGSRLRGTSCLVALSLNPHVPLTKHADYDENTKKRNFEFSPFIVVSLVFNFFLRFLFKLKKNTSSFQWKILLFKSFK